MKTDLVKKVWPLLPRILLRQLPRKIEIVSVAEKRSRLLNLIYRRKNKPANVLSFLYGLDVSRRSRQAKADYGEILICPVLIRREAKKQGNTYKYQMTWMVLHGMIHLAGLHHEESRRLAERVEKLEHSILRKLSSQAKL